MSIKKQQNKNRLPNKNRIFYKLNSFNWFQQKTFGEIQKSFAKSIKISFFLTFKIN